MSANAEINAFLRLNGAGFKRGLNRARKDLKEFRTGVNAELKHVGLAIGGAAVGASMIGIAFDSQMSEIQAASNATQQELRSLTAAARTMGDRTAHSAKQAAEGEYALASAGLNATEIMQALPAAMIYARATQTDLGKSAALVADAMHTFNLQAGESGRIVNVFAAATSVTPMRTEELTQAMEAGGVAAHALGLSLEETVAGLGLLHAANIRGSKAGSSFQAVLLKMQDTMVEGKGHIGAALQGWNSATEGLYGGLKRLEAGGITARVALAEFGDAGGPALAALLAQGAGRLSAVTAGVTGTSRTAAQAKIQMASTQARIAGLTNAIEEAALRVWDIFRGPVQKAIAGITTFIKKNYGAIVTFTSELVGAVLWVAKVAGTVFAFILKHSTTFKTLAAVILGAAAALYAIAGVMAIVNAVMALNPVTIWITAIAAAVSAVIVLVEKFIGWKVVWEELWYLLRLGFADVKMRVRQLWADIKQVGRVFEALGQSVGIIFGAIWKTIKSVGDLMGETFSTIWEAIKHPTEAKEAFDGLKAAFADGLGPVMDEAREKLVGVWAGMGDEFRSETVQIMGDYLTETGKIDAAHTKKMAQLKKDRERAKADSGGGPETPDVAPANNDINSILPQQFNFAKPLIDAKDDIFSVLDEINKGAKQSFTDMWDSFTDASITGSQRAAQVFAGLRQMVWGVIGEVTKRWLWGESVQMAATVTKEEVMTGATKTGTAVRIGSKLKEMATDLKTGVVNIWHAVTSFFKAHAGIPFVGVAMAAGAIAIMFKLLGSAKKALFYEGGLVGGPPGRDAVNAGLTRNEYVMPVEATRRWLPELEAMRRGSFAGSPAFVGAVPMGNGGGSLTLHTTVQVASGSLLLADNDLSVRRFADRIANVIEEKVNKTFRSKG